MVDVVQLVRTSDCDSEGRGFESHHSPEKSSLKGAFFISSTYGPFEDPCIPEGHRNREHCDLVLAF